MTDDLIKRAVFDTNHKIYAQMCIKTRYFLTVTQYKGTIKIDRKCYKKIKKKNLIKRFYVELVIKLKKTMEEFLITHPDHSIAYIEVFDVKSNILKKVGLCKYEMDWLIRIRKQQGIEQDEYSYSYESESDDSVEQSTTPKKYRSFKPQKMNVFNKN